MKNDRTFTLTWTLDAPAAEVFRAWTEPEQTRLVLQRHDAGARRADRARPARRRRLAPADGDRASRPRTRRAASTARSCVTRSSCSPGARKAAGRSSTPTRPEDSPLVTVTARPRRRAHGDDRHGRAAGGHDGRRACPKAGSATSATAGPTRSTGSLRRSRAHRSHRGECPRGPCPRDRPRDMALRATRVWQHPTDVGRALG